MKTITIECTDEIYLEVLAKLGEIFTAQRFKIISHDDKMFDVDEASGTVEFKLHWDGLNKKQDK